ncbi:hypothetical protein B0E53_04273 [Micromonospora sp. MH33]|uniref:hypothetical protein n=1 Tax=Micromonospora sp. MH33 TaxID=1945509 RepID=UPI000D148417|nr:hypothetical protein [Micromonospora sp. MH33]PSK63784.1 hypothetical protein B0E53_04273 [Micromonospora sp. MH33]
MASFGPGAAAVLATAAELHRIDGLPRSELIHLSVLGSASRPVRYIPWLVRSAVTARRPPSGQPTS